MRASTGVMQRDECHRPGQPSHLADPDGARYESDDSHCMLRMRRTPRPSRVGAHRRGSGRLEASTRAGQGRDPCRFAEHRKGCRS
jgi:hypothetical protein